MPQENVELVRRLNDLYNTRDFDELGKLMDPDFVWEMSRVEMPDSVRHAGLTALRRFVDTWDEGFASDHVEVEEMFDAGDRVLVVIHHSGRGRTSGIEVDQRYAMVWTLRDGRAVRMDMYPTRDEALAAAGLEG